MMPMSSIGEKVRVKRAEKGMTQAELAKAAKITQATVSRLESDEVTQLKSDKLRSLANALGVSVDFLIGERPQMGFDETLAHDEKAKVIFRGFEKLSEERRQELLDYVNFLLGQEKKRA